MKIKIFYQKREPLEKFEQRVNNFMADVHVVDVKYVEPTLGDYEGFYSEPTLIVLYELKKEN